MGIKTLVQLWRNRETKKKLREENSKLITEIMRLSSTPELDILERRKFVKVGSNYIVLPFEKDQIPDEVIKRKAAESMMDFLVPYIEYEFINDPSGNTVVQGCLYIAIKERESGEWIYTEEKQS